MKNKAIASREFAASSATTEIPAGKPEQRDLVVQYRAVNSLAPYVRNPRTHSPEQVDQIAASIQEFGFTNPILLDGSNGVVAGHGRLMAARKLGLVTVPCIELEGLTEERRRAYIIADNKLALNAGWDLALLKIELGDLQEAGMDLQLLGFTPDELADILQPAGTEGLTDPDAIPLAQELPLTSHGDTWILDNHRLLYGDATVAVEIETLMRGKLAHMVFTDPPYNIDYHGQGKNTSNRIKNDDMQALDFQTFLTAAFQNYSRHTNPDAGLYVFHASRTQRYFERALQENGFEIKNQLIWNKPAAALGWGDYRWKHEPFFYAGKKGQLTKFFGDRKHSTVWDFQKTDQQLVNWARRQKRLEAEGATTIWTMKRDSVSGYVHPTQKPVELISYAIINSSKPGDLVLDLFGGSGSTMIACERTTRTAHLMEIDPIYCDVIVRRWQNFTGKEATLEGDGRTFAEVKANRPGPVPVLQEANQAAVLRTSNVGL